MKKRRHSNCDGVAKKRPSGGFSLIEVALALFIMGIGFSTLLQMFPHSLRAGQIARAESAQTHFANAVFSMLRQKAMNTTNWDNWIKLNWIGDVCAYNSGLPSDAVPSNDFQKMKNLYGMNNSEDFDVGSYMVYVSQNANKTVVSVIMWSSQHDVTEISGSNINKGLMQNELIRQGASFYTEFYFMGEK